MILRRKQGVLLIIGDCTVSCGVVCLIAAEQCWARSCRNPCWVAQTARRVVILYASCRRASCTVLRCQFCQGEVLASLCLSLCTASSSASLRTGAGTVCRNCSYRSCSAISCRHQWQQSARNTNACQQQPCVPSRYHACKWAPIAYPVFLHQTACSIPYLSQQHSNRSIDLGRTNSTHPLLS
jgi:hypothetical protein